MPIFSNALTARCVVERIIRHGIDQEPRQADDDRDEPEGEHPT